MRFGPVPLAAAAGAVLAHSARAGGRRIAKGTWLGPDEIAALAAEGIDPVIVARLDPGDLWEDAAAGRLAAALVPDPAAAGLAVTAAHTGRVNLKAAGPGIVELDAGAVLRLNLVDPAITLATVPQWQRVTEGTLVGTVKIISYAVAGAALAAAEAAARGAIRVRPAVVSGASLILTAVPGQDPKLNESGAAAVAGRLAALGVPMVSVSEVAHETAAIAAALRAAPGEMVLILTGSATSDLHDDAPQALRDAGGRVARFGMPVDPGNLLFHGDLGGRPVIGLPGCARSPALNGADWVIERLACGVAVTDEDIAAMGVGGLLKEIPTRPQPRERRARRGAVPNPRAAVAGDL
ncbi:molybdopterin biosynthesis protein [Frigidibacter sp. MR17.24]|uniref:molybdopterin biosynthesis protein n=1 Tax=Frigidibacter sp. MR17.24 TaxID=3127345 RepID=UPI003012BAF7